ncbi:MAG: alpha/beta hydrolase family protein [Planctomycetota bacterium]|jgi:dipeptidyl aminopeptidase/acylaminoacyl peptidase
MATATRRRRSASRRHPVRPEDLLEFTSVADPRIAPDGEAIAFVHARAGKKNEYDRNIWLVPTDGGDPAPFTSGDRDSHPRWAPDGERLAFISARDKHRPQIYVIPAGGGEARPLTDFPEGSIGTFKWSPDGRHLAVSFREQAPEWTEAAKKERLENGRSDPPRVIDHWWYRLDGDGYFEDRRHALYLVDAETGDHRRLYDRDSLGFFTFDFSPDGRQIVIGTNRDRRAGLRPWNDELLRLDVRTGKLRPIPDLPEGPKDTVAWSPDGRWIAYAGRAGSPDSTYSTENLELWVCDATRGGAKRLTGKDDCCLMSVAITDTAEVTFGPTFCWSPDSRRLYALIGKHGEMHVASVRRGGGRLEFLTNGSADRGMGNISADGRMLALSESRPDRLAEVAVGHVETDGIVVERLTDLNGPLLKTRRLARPTSHWVKTADGTKVHVWVMRPPGAPAGRRTPAVLEIHGGPHAQYGVGFFHEFQTLAAAGYTVFYANPRGSKGYGRDHCAAIRGDWGGADWVDMQAVIEFMKGHRGVDPKRMGVMGGSYGGYMTNWIIGSCRDFAAAITDRCVSNLVSMGGTSDFMDPPDLYFPGNFWDRPEGRWKSSPIRLFGKVRTPTLIIHSEGDLRCNVEQAEQVFAALKLRNVPCRFVRYPRTTSHGMSRGGPPDMRLHRLHQVLDWWEKYL